MHAAVSRKREEIAALCRHYGAVQLEVFGSAARGKDFDPERSDADFLVRFDPDSALGLVQQYFGLARALRELLDRGCRSCHRPGDPQPVSARID